MGDQAPHDKLQHPTSFKRSDSGFVDGLPENSANGYSSAHSSYGSKNESPKLQPLEEEDEVTNREENKLKDRPYLRERSRSDPGFYSMPNGDVTPRGSFE